MWMILISLGLICYNGMFYSKDLLMSMIILEVLFFLYLYIYKWFHIMIILMLLELFMLKIFFFSLFYFMEITMNNFFTFLFITLSVAEASVGMSLLTMLVRVHGEDIILTMSI